MKTTFRFVCAMAVIACFSLSSHAQRQTALYIDNGSGGFTTLTATGGPGTLNLPSSGSLLSSGTSQVIDGLLTLGVNGQAGPVAGELDILDGGNPGNDATFLWNSGALNLQFSAPSTSSGAGINITGQYGSTGSGGGVTITGGGAAGSGIAGGGVSIAGGYGVSDPGGVVSIIGGGCSSGDGAEASIEGGSSTASGNGGEALVEGGTGDGAIGSLGGEASIVGGNGGTTGTTGGAGGSLIAEGGNGGSGSGANGNGGSVSIQGGTAGAGTGVSASNGSVSIQTMVGNTSIGNLGGTIQLSGTVALAGTLALGANGGTAGTLTIWDAASNSVNITYSVGHFQIPSGLNIGSAAGLTNNIASGGGGSENFFGESPITGNATNYFGVSTEFDGNVHNFMGNNGDEGTATNDIEGNNSATAATTIATYNNANNSVSMGNASSTVAITSSSGATAWSVTSAGAGTFASVSPTNLKGSGAGKYAEQHTLVAGDITSANVATIPNAIIAGTTSVVVANIVSTTAAGTLAPHGGATTTSGNVVLTLSSGNWTAGDVVNYIVVNP